jgi:hypothetical protein
MHRLSLMYFCSCWLCFGKQTGPAIVLRLKLPQVACNGNKSNKMLSSRTAGDLFYRT